MQLSREVKYFSAACKSILAAISTNRRLTHDEATIIEYSCKRVLAQVASVLKRE